MHPRADRAELQRLASAITQLYDLAVARVRPFMPHGTKIMSLRLMQQLLAEFQELWRPEVVERLPSNGSRAQSKPLDVAGFDPFGPQRMKEATMQLVSESGFGICSSCSGICACLVVTSVHSLPCMPL